MNDKVSTYGHQGDVLLDGRSIWHSGVELMALRRKVGMLFQRPNPFPMSIMDNVTAGARAHRMASKAGLRAIAEQRLTEVGLWNAVSDRLKDSPFRLSGGQQQLLCLARALAISPDVLLLDEPTSSLDPIATESIEALVRTLVPRITVVIVTHNLAQARRVADRTIFLNEGRLVEHGDTEQLFEHPARGGDGPLRQRPLRLTHDHPDAGSAVPAPGAWPRASTAAVARASVRVGLAHV